MYKFISFPLEGWNNRSVCNYTETLPALLVYAHYHITNESTTIGKKNSKQGNKLPTLMQRKGTKSKLYYDAHSLSKPYHRSRRNNKFTDFGLIRLSLTSLLISRTEIRNCIPRIRVPVTLPSIENNPVFIVPRNVILPVTPVSFFSKGIVLSHILPWPRNQGHS